MMMMMMMMGFLEAFVLFCFQVMSGVFFWQTLKKTNSSLCCVYELRRGFLSAILDVSCWSPLLGAIHKKPQMIK
jgi:hypothetical protein